MLKLDLSKCVDENKFLAYQEDVTRINDMINKRNGAGADYLGWADYPVNYDKEELERIIKDAQYVRDNFEVLVVCGIGGSYLGARSAIEALKGLYPDDKLEIIFFGNTFSPNYTKQVLDYLKYKKFAINVISKSGTTTETAIAFRLLKELLESKAGKDGARKAIFATTSKDRGALKTLCDKEGYATYVLPDDVGGRYSVFTAVGLFPMAAAGLDVREFLKGAQEARELYNNDNIKENACYRYALTRDYMYKYNHKSVELYVQYELQYVQISEWLKQLFGESEGKERKALLPNSVCFTTDLHSLGQFVQDGTPLLFETIIRVKNPNLDTTVPHDDDDLDGLNYLEGKNLAFVNEKAFEGTLKAHVDGGVPCGVIELDKMDEHNLGHMYYFFMRACAMSAYLLGINPFNQPGVEIYKKNMFHLLGKKGY